MTTDRDDVYMDIWRALERHGLGGYADGVMDSLDTVVEWDDVDEREVDDDE